MEPNRITVAEACARVKAGHAQLVCAYPDRETCSKMRLPGAVTRTELQSRFPQLPKEREIIFYCA
jgi:hypothetical protein